MAIDYLSGVSLGILTNEMITSWNKVDSRAELSPGQGKLP